MCVSVCVCMCVYVCVCVCARSCKRILIVENYKCLPCIEMSPCPCKPFSVNPLLTIRNSLKKQKRLYKELTPSIKTPI